MIRMFTSAHASSYEQCSWWKDKKSSKRRFCIRDNLASDQNQAKSPWNMGLKLQTHYLLFPAQWPRQIWFNFILLYPATFDAYGEVTFWWIKLNKSHVTPGTNPETHQDIHHWWTQMKNIMNINILMKNTATFWCSSWEHNNILMVRMFTQIFKSKLVGPRTRGITPLVTLQRLYEPKNSINRDQRLSITCTIAKHTSKQLEIVFGSCNWNWSMTKDFWFLSAHQYSLLSLWKITSSSSSSSSAWFSNIQTSHKL